MIERPPKRVLITGGSGFVGTNLVSFFSEKGCDVRNFDIVFPRNKKHFQFWKRVDLLDRNQLIKETKDFGPSVVLHLAARTDLNEGGNLAGYKSNFEGTCNLIDAVRSTPSVERAVFASSQLVCRLGYSPVDEHDYQPTTLYGLSKMFTERIIRVADEMGAIWTIVRPTSLWGPWFDVPYKSFFLAITRNVYLHPSGNKILKQWGFIGNTIYQVWRLIHCPSHLVHKNTFYMADYEPLDLQEFANKIRFLLHTKPIRTVPRGLIMTAARFGDLAQKLGWKNPPLTSFRYNNIVTSELQDITPLRKIVGPLPYTVEQGIEITVRWLREQSYLAYRRDLFKGDKVSKALQMIKLPSSSREIGGEALFSDEK